jgi:aminoglycoside phosphotransferase (APT) family kinase protein
VQLVEWIAGFVERLPEIVQIDTVESCGSLACILHGDYWNNNMLFKYSDDGKTPIALKMIDFQVVRIGHPLSDVLYFLYISAKPEIRARYMTDLLRHYYDTLTTDLLLLGISLDDYSREDFLADYKKRSLMWMFMGIIVLSFVLNKKVLDRLDEMDAAERQKEPKGNYY